MVLDASFLPAIWIPWSTTGIWNSLAGEKCPVRCPHNDFQSSRNTYFSTLWSSWRQMDLCFTSLQAWICLSPILKSSSMWLQILWRWKRSVLQQVFALRSWWHASRWVSTDRVAWPLAQRNFITVQKLWNETIESLSGRSFSCWPPLTQNYMPSGSGHSSSSGSDSKDSGSDDISDEDIEMDIGSGSSGHLDLGCFVVTNYFPNE